MRFAKRIVILLALSLVIGGASVVLAASAEPGGAVQHDAAVRLNDEPTPTPTDVPTSTLPIHPVGTAIAKFFGVPYPDVMALHESGVGFGVIARAYMTAQVSDGRLTPQDALALFQSGVGWGEIAKEYGVHPGGRGLGAVMRDHTKEGKPPVESTGGSDPDPCRGNRCNAPGHDKPGGKGPKK